jgi:hypothetical protein
MLFSMLTPPRPATWGSLSLVPELQFATLTIRQSFATAHRVLRAQSTVVSVAILAFVDPLRVCGSENSIVLFCDVLATV